ncbi:MAG: hypothetical protein AMS24_04490 [Chlamydiae bacterium SM23_39]|nr:MAG: hypothetical protein AMS24_04490 [Chlamydiae bacterium SM23_39]
MRWFLAFFLCSVGRILLSLRYRIKVKGRKNLKKKNFKKDIGTLFLPNHPALVDPIIISILFWPKFHIHPLVIEYVYRQSGINFIMRLFKALSIPNMDTSLNEIKIKNAQGVVEKIIKGLKEKKNYIIYPAGRLKHTGKEIVGGASATQNILQNCPDVNIVLIRTTGLWGSSFSRAYTGKTPDFKSTLIRNIKHLFLNFLVFMPRRRVLIEVELAAEDFPRSGSRLEVNRYLEKWYNKYPINGIFLESEPLNLISYSFWKKKIYKIHKTEEIMRKKEEVKFSSKVEEKIFSELNRLQPDIPITSNLNLSRDLGLDSLDISELISFLCVNFDIEQIHPEDIETVQDVLEIAEGKKKIKKVEKPEIFYSWPKEKKRGDIIIPDKETIFESFLHTCDRMKNFSACGDDLMGVLSYNKIKLAAILFSQKIKRMGGTYIGVLLPASVVSYIVIFAIMLAKKIPVMLNWTAGPRNLNHMVSKANVKSIITSWRFLERISNIEFGDITNKLYLVEDLKKEITFKEKVKSFFIFKLKAKNIIKILNLGNIKKDDPAVILFTSGTESYPKGVKLSHNNILSNQRAALKCVDLKSEDILYGILPPFHSFGFSVAGIFPIISGLKVAFSPDPTDSYAIAEGIERWKISLLCAAPSFLKGIIKAATEEQLKSVRLFVTGAEKAPKELFNKVRSLSKKIIEGYGITECSPMISLTREEEAEDKGVGKILPGIEFCTINPETEKVLSKNEEGEICVRGPNVFSGYLEKEIKSPFIEIDGKEWYRTGDLGYLDKSDNLILSGRLKRFTKIGGEMVSLGGIEEIILKDLISKNIDLGEGAPLAVCAIEKHAEKTELVLFTTLSLDKNEVNMILKKAGCSRLIKINKVKIMDQIPLMGTGKVDYRFLQKMIE